MTPPTPGRKRKPTAKELRAVEAKGREDRRAAIVELYQDGKSQVFIASLTGLTLSRVGQILRKAGVLSDSQTDPDKLLTPAELRQCRRENSRHNGALEWLAGQRTDRRHNGQPMARERTNEDSLLEDPWDLGDEPLN
ncbi:hypothetical protein [Singulisphaera sp. PoT]|uniref:hypothetical protein n=1 Tax=Singulisphaera sp. PoT TaxID=3411797 RepID=UPI003BF50D8F